MSIQFTDEVMRLLKLGRMRMLLGEVARDGSGADFDIVKTS